jgi:hypothetical protein
MDIIQNQLFNHTINLGSELARWRRGRDLAVAYDHYAAMQFDAVFEEATGCKPEVLFEVGLSAILKLREEKTVRLDPVIFNQLEYAPGEVAAAVDLVATDMDHLQELVVQEYEESGIDWAANSLRRYPIVRCQDGKLLVLVPQFLIQRVCGSGFHWEVLNELNGRRRRATGAAKSEAKQLIGSFGVFTGHAAEEYAADRLERIVPNHGGLAKQLWREQDLQQIWPDEKCCDFLIDGGHAWVAMDAVNHAITAKAAAAGSVAALQQDLEYIIDEKAVQLDATIGRLIESGGSLPGQPAPHLRPRYHPVIVAAAGFPWSPIMAAAVHERLREKGLLQHDLIDPLTVITTQELEFLEHAVANGRVALVEMLDHRTQTHQVEVPVDMYLFGRASLQLPASLIEPLNVAFNHLAHALGLGEFRSESSDQEDVGD